MSSNEGIIQCLVSNLELEPNSMAVPGVPGIKSLPYRANIWKSISEISLISLKWKRKADSTTAEAKNSSIITFSCTRDRVRSWEARMSTTMMRKTSAVLTTLRMISLRGFNTGRKWFRTMNSIPRGYEAIKIPTWEKFDNWVRPTRSRRIFTSVSVVLDPPIVARRLRFYPVSKQTRTVCMRVEVWVSPVKEISTEDIRLIDLVTAVCFPMGSSPMPCRKVAPMSMRWMMRHTMENMTPKANFSSMV